MKKQSSLKDNQSIPSKFLKGLKKKIPFTIAIRYTLIYLLFGISWILITDQIAIYFAEDQMSLELFQRVKGIIFIIITASLVFLLVKKGSNVMKVLHKEKNELENTILQFQKFEMMEIYKKEIAHNIKNHFMIIENLSEFGLNENLSREQIMEYFEDILNSSKRAHQELKEFMGQTILTSIKGKEKRKMISLKKIINENKSSYQKLIGQNFRLFFDLNNHNDYYLKVIKHDLEQIILNLLINARYAIEKRNRKTKLKRGKNIIHIGLSKTLKGDIKINRKTKENKYLDEMIQSDYFHTFPDKKIFFQITITDNGCGMNSNVQKNIFKPFYTTKSKENGTGLGLIIVKRLVEKYKGIITFESKFGEGTKFQIFLPSKN